MNAAMVEADPAAPLRVPPVGGPEVLALVTKYVVLPRHEVDRRARGRETPRGTTGNKGEAPSVS
jgi:hypothetical protein